MRLKVGDPMPSELTARQLDNRPPLNEGQWHLTRCWSGAERHVADWLTGLGFETFVPMRIEKKNIAKGRGEPERVEVERPAIPGYVPARMSHETLFAIQLSPTLRPAWRWSPYAWENTQGAQPVIMRDAVVERLRQMDEVGAFNAPEIQRPQIERNDWVRIQLRNANGIVVYEGISVVIDIVGGRLRVGLKLLGREMTVPIEEVELVEKAAAGA